MSTTQMNVQSIPSTNTFSILVWIRQHPILAYFFIAFAGTWLLDLPMVLGKDGLGLFGYNVPMTVYIILFILGSFSGPTVAAYLVTNAIDGKAGMQKFFRRYGQWRVGMRWYLLAIFGFPLVYILAGSVVLHSLPLADIRANWLTFFSTYLPALLIFPAFITWGEEPGWRGFALTRMQEHYHPLVSTLTVGLMHGLWHLPVYLLVFGPPALGPFDITKFAANTFGIMMITIVWSWVFNNAKGSILFAVLLHASLNASQAWMSILIPNYPDGAGKIALGFYVAAALALILITKGRLGYKTKKVQPLIENEAVN